jgi:hypothetical protein
LSAFSCDLGLNMSKSPSGAHFAPQVGRAFPLLVVAYRSSCSHMSLNLATAAAIGFAWSNREAHVAITLDPCNMFPDHPAIDLAIIVLSVWYSQLERCRPQLQAIQGPALGSALQTAFQLGNASTCWLGIIIGTFPILCIHTKSSLYHLHAYAPCLLGGWLACAAPACLLVSAGPLLLRVAQSLLDFLNGCLVACVLTDVVADLNSVPT